MKKLIGLSAALLSLLAFAPNVTATPGGSSWSGSSSWNRYGTNRSSSYTNRTSRTWNRRSPSSWSTSGVRSRYGHTQAPQRVWVPGRWVFETKKHWAPGWSEKVWQPPVFETRFDFCGNSYQVQINAGFYRTVHHPGRWEYRKQKVWQAPHWDLLG